MGHNEHFLPYWILISKYSRWQIEFSIVGLLLFPIVASGNMDSSSLIIRQSERGMARVTAGNSNSSSFPDGFLFGSIFLATSYFRFLFTCHNPLSMVSSPTVLGIYWLFCAFFHSTFFFFLRRAFNFISWIHLFLLQNPQFHVPVCL